MVPYDEINLELFKDVGVEKDEVGQEGTREMFGIVFNPQRHTERRC
jgi:hypothetical protein